MEDKYESISESTNVDILRSPETPGYEAANAGTASVTVARNSGGLKVPRSASDFEPGESMGHSLSVASNRSIMAGVQRRIKLMEELNPNENRRGRSSWTGAMFAQANSAGPRCVVSLPCLIMGLVTFTALSTGGGILIALEVHWALEDDASSIRVTCLVIFALALIASLVLGLMLSNGISRPLRDAVRIVDSASRPGAGGNHTDILQKLSQSSHIMELGRIQAASAELLGSVEVFKKYLPETIVKDILQGDERARRLHVSRRHVSIMFSDLQDFTTISEQLTQQNLLFLLTRYLSTMTRIIDSYEGVVAEILGDGVLAFWNTPDDVEMHAAKACAASLAQCEALESLNTEFAPLGFPHLALRIGIHTGVVLTGNIGSEKKMKFGCMGDPVNLASRLEGLCKMYGVSILCSDATHDELPKDNCFCTRQVDNVQVKGKNNPTRVYEVMGLDPLMGSTSQSDVSTGSEGVPTCSVNVKHFAHVAKEAMVESEQAMKDQDVVDQNPFVRLLRKNTRHMSSGSKSQCSKKTLDSEETPLPFQPQKSFSEIASKLTNTTGGGRTRTATFQDRAYAASYERALTQYQKGQFLAARDLAVHCLQTQPDDRAASLLMQRASRYLGPNNEIVGLSEAELKEWSGVNVMTDK